ncbi:hypothetical protein GCM10023178_53290 [Actinomadura luteofluorescens]
MREASNSRAYGLFITSVMFSVLMAAVMVVRLSCVAAPCLTCGAIVRSPRPAD